MDIEFDKKKIKRLYLYYHFGIPSEHKIDLHNMNKPTLYYSQYTQCLLVSKSDLHQSPCLPRECTTQGWLCTAPVWAKHRHMTKQRQWVRTQTAAPPWSDVRGLEGGYATGGDTRTGRLSIRRGWRVTDTNETGWTGPLSTTFWFPYESATEIK